MIENEKEERSGEGAVGMRDGVCERDKHKPCRHMPLCQGIC